MRLKSSVDVVVAHIPLRRSVALTWRGWGTLVVFAGAVAAAAVAPSPAGIGLCIGLAVALAAGTVTVVRAWGRQAGGLRGTLSGPELVPRGERADLKLNLVGPEPILGCRICLDGLSLRWRQKGSDSTGSRVGVRSRHLAPPARGRLHMGTVGSGRKAEPSLQASAATSESRCATAVGVAIPTWRRGIQVCHGGTLWLYDAFGLIGARLATLPDLAVVVHPVPVGSPLAGPSARSGQAGYEMGPARLSELGREDLIGLRPHRPGDRLSSIHWRSFTGTTPLLVRELGRTQARLPWLILDDRAGVHRRGAFEAALDFMVSALVRPAVGGPTVEVRLLTSDDVLPVALGIPTVDLLRWLAVVEPRRSSGLGAGGFQAQWQLGSSDTVVTTATGAESLGVLRDLGVRLMVVE